MLLLPCCIAHQNRTPPNQSGNVIGRTARLIFALVDTSVVQVASVFGAPASLFWGFTHFLRPMSFSCPSSFLAQAPFLLYSIVHLQSCEVLSCRIVQLVLIICSVSTVVLVSFSLPYFMIHFIALTWTFPEFTCSYFAGLSSFLALPFHTSLFKYCTFMIFILYMFIFRNF